MANRIILNLRFTTEKGMGLSLKATVKGTSKANYKKVQGLRNPDYSYWDNKSQCFNQPSLDAIHNNKVLQEMRDHYQKLLDTGKIQDGKQLFSDNPLEERQEKPSVLTLGAYLQRLIDSMKSEKVQMPSKNYQCYITLLHKLELEKNVIEVPLKDVDDTQFMKFSNFVLNELNGVNYIGLMKKFHATIVKARKEKLTVHVLDYPYREKAPRNIIKAAEKAQNGVDILTVKQYKKFVEMDLNEVPHGNKMQVKYMELYRDFCVFIYEMKMRPCDVVKLNVSDIKGNNIIYWATKKKNYINESSSFVVTPLTKTSKAIIEKYRGKSSKGYVFPFAMNEYDWDFKDAVSFNKWNNRKQATQERINVFLRKVADIFGVSKLTIYTFRHSTFTHKIMSGANLMQLAKEGGTSVSMLEHHYFNHIKH